MKLQCAVGIRRPMNRDAVHGGWPDRPRCVPRAGPPAAWLPVDMRRRELSTLQNAISSGVCAVLLRWLTMEHACLHGVIRSRAPGLRGPLGPIGPDPSAGPEPE
jgi:hypothetical protein